MNMETRLKVQKYVRMNYPVGKEFTARSVVEGMSGRYYSPTSVEVANALRMMGDVKVVSSKVSTNKTTIYVRECEA